VIVVSAAVPERLIDELRRYFDEARLVELTAVIAWENQRVRFNDALGIGYQGFSEGSSRLLPGNLGQSTSRRA
jgi:hypothetical protein